MEDRDIVLRRLAELLWSAHKRAGGCAVDTDCKTCYYIGLGLELGYGGHGSAREPLRADS